MLDTYISAIQIENFRNLELNQIECVSHLNYFHGGNGNGKSNFLEALTFLFNRKSFRKFSSYSHVKPSHLPELKEVVIKAELRNTLNNCSSWFSLKMVEKVNSFYLNGELLKKSFSFPKIRAITITPFEAHTFYLTSKQRRDFFDKNLSLLSDLYCEELRKYNRLIKFRNELLRYSSSTSSELELEIIHEKLALLSFSIIKKRIELIDEINILFARENTFNDYENHKMLSIKLKSDFSNLSVEEIFNKFSHNVKKDVVLGFTSIGIHLDDYEFMLNTILVNNFASTGQQRMCYFNLILICVKIFKNKFQLLPVFLIDDLSSELDKNNWSLLLKYILDNNFQAFITTTNEELIQMTDFIRYSPIKKFNISRGVISTFN